MGTDQSLCAVGGEGTDPSASAIVLSWNPPCLWVSALPSENIPWGPQPVCRNLRASIPDISLINVSHVAWSQFPPFLLFSAQVGPRSEDWGLPVASAKCL